MKWLEKGSRWRVTHRCDTRWVDVTGVDAGAYMARVLTDDGKKWDILIDEYVWEPLKSR